MTLDSAADVVTGALWQQSQGGSQDEAKQFVYVCGAALGFVLVPH